MTAFAVLAAMAAIPAHAQMNKMSATDRMFVMKVAQGNMAEVMSSRLALKKSKDEKVRMIAEMLIKEHGQAQADLKSTAKTLKYKLPASTDAKHKAMYRKLSRLSGMTFDKAYMMGQVGDHYATIALFKKELENGSDSNIRNFAAKYQPGIENHTKMITSTAGRFGIPVAKEGEGMAMSAMKPSRGR